MKKRKMNKNKFKINKPNKFQQLNKAKSFLPFLFNSKT